MTHKLPLHIHEFLHTWDNMGFTSKREAAEFILANKDWDTLVKQRIKPEDVAAVNMWREKIWNAERGHALVRKGIE
jgi:hypothetical protein